MRQTASYACRLPGFTSLGPQLYTSTVLGVDSMSILFNHRSFQKPDPFPCIFDGFLRRFGPVERMGKAPLEL